MLKISSFKNLSLLSFVALLYSCGSDDGAGSGNSDCGHGEISFSELQKEADAFQLRHGLKVALTKNDCRENDLLNCKAIPKNHYPRVYDYFRNSKSFMSPYPTGFFTKIGLKVLLFVDKLSPGLLTKNVAGIAAKIGRGSVVFINTQQLKKCSEKINARVTHHEIGHAVDFGFSETTLASRALGKLNPKNFKYGSYKGLDGGVLSFDHPQTGFVSRYAMVNEGEDFAELISLFWSDIDDGTLRTWLESDRHLTAKLTYTALVLARDSKELVARMPKYPTLKDELQKLAHETSRDPQLKANHGP